MPPNVRQPPHEEHVSEHIHAHGDGGVIHQNDVYKCEQSVNLDIDLNLVSSIDDLVLWKEEEWERSGLIVDKTILSEESSFLATMLFDIGTAAPHFAVSNA